MRFYISLILFILPTFAMATSIVGLEPELNYDKSITVDHNLKNTLKINVQIESYRFPNSSQKKRFQKALALLPQVLNSYEFKSKVIAYTRSGKGRNYQKNYLWNDKEKTLTNEEIYNVIMTGDEKMIPGSTGEMNIYSWVKYCNWRQTIRSPLWCSKVIGSTSPKSSKWIKLNWKFYKKFRTDQMVSNLVHEWIHLLGFLHGKENMTQEVPYVVGSIAGEVAAQILEDERVKRLALK